MISARSRRGTHDFVLAAFVVLFVVRPALTPQVPRWPALVPPPGLNTGYGPVVGDVPTFTIGGVENAVPLLKLPDGKRSILDPVNVLRVVDEAPPDGQVAAAALWERLVYGVAPVDVLTALLILCSLGLGLVDTKRRWIDYAAEAFAWLLYGLQPEAMVPARVVPGELEDVEKVRAARAAARRLAGDLAVVRRPEERLRLEVAAARAVAADDRLLPLARSLRTAAAAGVPQAATPQSRVDALSAASILDGQWDCLCDYRMDGRPMNVQMKIEGSSGKYYADGAVHRISDITPRKCPWEEKEADQPLPMEFTFRWKNTKEGDSGTGSWLASPRGDCVDGTWIVDGQNGELWSWSGTKRSSLVGAVFLSRQSLPGTQRNELEDSAAMSVAEIVDSTLSQSASSKEALVRAWEEAAPDSVFWGAFSEKNVPARLWQAVGTELRMLLGLSAEGLMQKELRNLAFGLVLFAFFAISALLARVLVIAIGSHTDAAVWATFGAGFAVVIDSTRREGIAQAFNPESKVQREKSAKCLAALRRWADAGNLNRHGEARRETVLEAVRRGVAEIRLADSNGELPEGELERLVEAWHPGLRRRFERSGADVILPGEERADFRKRQETSKKSPILVVYENLSVPESVGKGIWR